MLSKCQICLEVSNPSVVTSCGHSYCRECLDGWTASSRSTRSCPICKRQLKKEEFQELTSGVCSICQNKPKFPGSLSCWACHCKTQCDQGLETSQAIPIYRTESVEEADQAIPPRPVLQPDDNSGSSTHVIQIDEDDSSSSTSSENNRFFDTIKLILRSIGGVIFIAILIAILGLLIFPMIGVFFLPWTTSSVDAHHAKCGFFFIGGLTSLISLALTWAESDENKLKIVKAAYALGTLISVITFFMIATTLTKHNQFSNIWFFSYFTWLCGHILMMILIILYFSPGQTPMGCVCL